MPAGTDLTLNGAMLRFDVANSPEFAVQFKTALETFLRNPGWIQFELRPATPIAASQITPLVGAPAELIKLLNPSVTAGAAEE